jgi:hypothetical protein
MATRNEWLALAERFESAERPDREMDVRILLACGWVLERRGNDRKAWLYSPFSSCGQQDLFLQIRQDPFLLDAFVRPSRSIDAITAMIGREFPQFELSISVGAENCSVGLYAPGLGRGVGVAVTEALARTAAFCRAMADGVRAKE